MEKEIEIFIEAAEQLQALKATIAEQQGASVRLRGLTETLEKVGTQIAKIPTALSAVITKAEAVEQRIIVATGKVEELRDGIPVIVERIERSDLGKSIDVLTNDITGSRDDLKAFRESIFKIDEVVQKFRIENDAVFKELRDDSRKTGEVQEKLHTSVHALRSELITKLDDLEKRILNTEKWSEKSVSATQKTFEVLTSDITGSRNDLKALQESIFKTNELVQQFRSETDAVLKELKEDACNISTAQEKLNASVYTLQSEAIGKLEGLEKRIISTEQWSEKSVGVTKKAFEVIGAAIKGTGERQTAALQEIQSELNAIRAKEMAEMREVLQSISALVLQQSSTLETLSKKKGLLF